MKTLKDLIQHLESLTDKGENQKLSSDEEKEIQMVSEIVSVFETMKSPISDLEQKYSPIIKDLFLDLYD